MLARWVRLSDRGKRKADQNMRILIDLVIATALEIIGDKKTDKVSDIIRRMLGARSADLSPLAAIRVEPLTTTSSFATYGN